MKSELFSGSRFWTYYKYDLTQLWRNHMKAAVGIGLSGLIAYVFVVLLSLIRGIGWHGIPFDARFAIMVAAFAALQLYQTRTYGHLTDKSKGSAWLMVPASCFEKWLSMIINTLIVIPLAFFVTYLAVDSLLCLLDPGIGTAVASQISGGLGSFSSGLVQVNGTYDTTWSLGMVVGILLASYCVNFLYYLLCGICFKKNKILSALGIAMVAGLVLSLILGATGLESLVEAPDYEDFASAEKDIRALLGTLTAVMWIVAAGLAAGIYFRIKTIKH